MSCSGRNFSEMERHAATGSLGSDYLDKHIWREALNSEVKVCARCGIAILEVFGDCPIMYDPCPPWAPTGEGNTETKRAFEAGEVEDLKMIQRMIADFQDISRVKNDLLDLAKIRLGMVIQKRDGLEK